MHNEENGGKKRIFADLVALHQSIVSESPNEAVKMTDSKVSKKPRPQNLSASPDAIADNRYELFCEQMPMGVLTSE
jgi:hypothetical protein